MTAPFILQVWAHGQNGRLGINVTCLVVSVIDIVTENVLKMFVSRKMVAMEWERWNGKRAINPYVYVSFISLSYHMSSNFNYVIFLD